MAANCKARVFENRIPVSSRIVRLLYSIFFEEEVGLPYVF